MSEFEKTVWNKSEFSNSYIDMAEVYIVERRKMFEILKPDLLEYQLNALRQAGFTEVDCYYKYGIFSIFGGKKWEK